MLCLLEYKGTIMPRHSSHDTTIIVLLLLCLCTIFLLRPL